MYTSFNLSEYTYKLLLYAENLIKNLSEFCVSSYRKHKIYFSYAVTFTRPKSGLIKFNIDI